MLSIAGTIFNDPSSTVILKGLNEFIDNSPIGGLDAPKTSINHSINDVLGIYYVDHGPLGDATFQSQFEGVIIAPGESYSFELYTLIPGFGATSFNPTPEFNPAPLGTYNITNNGLSINGFGEGSGPGFYEGGAVEITVVPIPASLFLFLSGIIGILYQAKMRSNR